MNKFRKLSYIDYNSDYSSRISVHNSLLNVVLHDPPAGPPDDIELPEL
jgi:hypothetical protein